ncbi:hypothetical protein [Halomicronema sp. CCY15110]|uniref:hypothetical protein n=1 Tax=Halomicronema sp. CCY15110 TaxID=2767773 RepID=UPI0019516D34|nr:hypothetical protein [Halomicronema sp. CCY15110]
MAGKIDITAASAQGPQENGRDRVRIMVMGSPEGVENIVKSLHILRFAEMKEWSNPLPTGRAGEVMRILTKIVLQADIR